MKRACVQSIAIPAFSLAIMWTGVSYSGEATLERPDHDGYVGRPIPERTAANLLPAAPTPAAAPEAKTADTAPPEPAPHADALVVHEDVFVDHSYGGPVCDSCVPPPNMIGDFFGPAGTQLSLAEFFPFDPFGLLPFGAAGPFTDRFLLPNPAASVVGRQKIAENNSPIPRDRVYFNYSSFDDVPLAKTSIRINRYTPGWEKTFFGGRASAEIRVPFASTIDSNIPLLGAAPTFAPQFDFVAPVKDEFEFGNMNFNFKAILYNASPLAVSAGLGVTVPTADDIKLIENRNGFGFPGIAPQGSTLIQVKNRSVHLLPFLGAVYTPNSRFFAQGFAQIDIDCNGNPVYADVDQLVAQLPTGTFVAPTPGAPNGLTSFRQIGNANDATYMYLDVGVGTWMYRSNAGLIRGIAPTAELHYARSLGQTDGVTGITNFEPAGVGPDFVRYHTDTLDLLNVVLGGTVNVRDNAAVAVGIGAPIFGDDDDRFDWELRASLNWYFGRRGL